MNEGLMIRDAAIEPDDSDALHDEIRQLRRELAEARRETANARHESSRAMSALRTQLQPLYRALQMVFGELDAAHAQDSPVNAGNPRVTAVWDAWKSKMGSTAKLIDALLLHGEMNTQQLAIATGFHRTTIPAHIFKLNKAGLINKNGGKFSLKQL